MQAMASIGMKLLPMIIGNTDTTVLGGHLMR
jgi:hypothetical protein